MGIKENNGLEDSYPPAYPKPKMSSIYLGFLQIFEFVNIIYRFRYVQLLCIHISSYIYSIQFFSP